MDEAELKQKYYMYELLKERIKELMKEKAEIDETVMKLTMTYEAIEELKKGARKMFAPLGSAFVPVEIAGNEVMVSIGANIAITTSHDDALRILGQRLEALKKASKEFNEEIIKARKELDSLAVQLQNFVDEKGLGE